jgi:predicted Fe-Mo cluster-binding NifX family protein
MKIAVVTDNQTTISKHFGRALTYLVFTIEDGKVVASEQRAKPGHQHHGHDHQHSQPVMLHAEGEGFEGRAEDTHSSMVAPVRDCEVVISGGMGNGAYQSLQQAGLRPILTDVRDIGQAVQAYIDGTLVHHPEILH